MLYWVTNNSNKKTGAAQHKFKMIILIPAETCKKKNDNSQGYGFMRSFTDL
jgi:hypothetical protein